MKKLTRDHAIIAGAGLLTTIVVCAFVYLSLQSPIAYAEDVYPADKPSYLPGQTVYFTTTFIVRVSEGFSSTAASVWDLERGGRAKMCDGVTNWLPAVPPIYDPPTEWRNVWRTSAARLEIPAGLRAGRYVYRVTSAQLFRWPDSFQVYFTVTHPPGYIC